LDNAHKFFTEDNNMNRLVALVSLIFMMAACTQSAPSADPSVIQSRSAEWDAALNAGDIDALAALYTDDARIMAPNAEMMVGTEAVRSAFGGMIDAGMTSSLTSIDISISGDVAHNIGTYALMAGDEQIDAGKFIETWERGEDGVWRISNDIYNSDLPVAAPEMPSMPMTHVAISHEVEDADVWLAAWEGDDGRRAMFRANGVPHVHVLQNADNPNLTGLILGVADMAALTAMLESEEGQAAAAEDGVKWDTVIMLTEID
jgi:ketosteroid isomerase-like protein